MKNIGVVICTPSVGMTHIAYAMSLGKLSNYFSRVPVWNGIESQMLGFQTIIGSCIAGARDTMIDQVISTPGATHVLFIDEDMGFASDTLHTMINRKLPIVICNYRRRVPPAWFTAKALGQPENIEITEDSTGVVEAEFGGFGFALIEKRVLEAVAKPRFLVKWNEVSGDYGTEDVPFFEAAREAGYACHVDLDASKKVWHNGSIEYNWFNKYDVISMDK